MKKLRTMMAYMLAAVSIIAVSCSDDDDDSGKGTTGNKPVIELADNAEIVDLKLVLDTRATYQLLPILKNSTDAAPEFEYKVSNATIATIDPTGLITVGEVGGGNANVTVIYKKDPSVVAYFLLKTTLVPVESVTASTDPVVVNTGQDFVLNPYFTLLPVDATNQMLKFEVTPELTIDTVNNHDATTVFDRVTYKFNAAEPGEYSVVAISEQNETIKSEPFIITVEQRVTSVEVAATTENMAPDEILDLTEYFSVLPANSTVPDLTYEITSGAGTLVDGVFTASSTPGDVVVTATSVDNAELSKSITISVNPPVLATAISLQSIATGKPKIPDMIFVSVGGTLKYGGLAAHFEPTPADAPMTFTSGDETIVKIVKNVPQFLAVGTTTIRAASKYAPSVYVDIPVTVLDPADEVLTELKKPNVPSLPTGREFGWSYMVDTRPQGKVNSTMLYVRPQDDSKVTINFAAHKFTIVTSGAKVNVFSKDGSQLHYEATL